MCVCVCHRVAIWPTRGDFLPVTQGGVFAPRDERPPEAEDVGLHSKERRTPEVPAVYMTVHILFSGPSVDHVVRASGVGGWVSV